MLVALVGATGSGKSTALDVARTLGYQTINMDRYVHELYEFGRPGYRAVRDALGERFVNARGVDRKLLAEAVFSDPAAFATLKRAVYPLLVAKLSEMDGDWVVEMPAYTNDPDYWRPHFAAVVLVRSPQGSRAERIAKKMRDVGNFSTAAVGNYLNLVNPHLRNPDFTVDNEESLADFQGAVSAVLQRVFKQ